MYSRQRSTSSLLGPTGDSHKEGYDHYFVSTVEAKYECPICLMVLRDPMQTECGHRFCRVCIQRWLRENKHAKCPVDNNKLSQVQLFPDNFAKREIMQLDVRCPNCKHGCQTVCELKQLENHLSMECEFVLVPCPNQCSALVFKSHIANHQKEECVKRRVKCKRCQVEVTYEQREEHMAECPEMEEVCIYCGATVLRKNVVEHEVMQCSKAPIDCSFSKFGCKVKLPRPEMPSHMTSSIQSHLLSVSEAVYHLQGVGSLPSPTAVVSDTDSLASSLACLATDVTSGFGTFDSLPKGTELPGAYQTLAQHCHLQGNTLAKQRQELLELRNKVSDCEKQLQDQATKLKDCESTISDFESRLCNGHYMWKLQGFTQLRHEAMSGGATAVHSPGFYSSFHGYKLCVRLNPNGVESAAGTHLSLFIHFMKGAYDTVLDWPFSGSITLHVLDQNDSSEYRQHISETLVSKPTLAAFQRPVSSRNHKGFGYIEFAPLSLIDAASYVKNDTLLIKVVVTEH